MNISEKSSAGRNERYATGDRFFINLGKMDGIEKGGLLNVIDTYCGVRQSHVGKIELKGAYSFFEVDKATSKAIQKGFSGAEFQGRKIRVEITAAKPPVRGKGASKPGKYKNNKSKKGRKKQSWK